MPELKAMCGGLGRCGQVQAIRTKRARVPGNVDPRIYRTAMPRLPFQPHRLITAGAVVYSGCYVSYRD
jgi:hypothetical protein